MRTFVPFPERLQRFGQHRPERLGWLRVPVLRAKAVPCGGICRQVSEQRDVVPDSEDKRSPLHIHDLNGLVRRQLTGGQDDYGASLFHLGPLGQPADQPNYQNENQA